MQDSRPSIGVINAGAVCKCGARCDVRLRFISATPSDAQLAARRAAFVARLFAVARGFAVGSERCVCPRCQRVADEGGSIVWPYSNPEDAS